MDHLLKIFKEKGIIKIINDDLKFFNHLDKGYKNLHQIKFINVLEDINPSYKHIEGDLLLKYLLKDKGYIKISYKECQNISLDDILSDILRRGNLEVNENFYDLIFMRERFRMRRGGMRRRGIRRRMGMEWIYFTNFPATIADRVYRPIFNLGRRCHYYEFRYYITSSIRELEDKLDEKRQTFIKDNYFRDYAKEHRDLLKNRIKSKINLRRKNNLRKSQDKHKSLLKYKKLNRRHK